MKRVFLFWGLLSLLTQAQAQDTPLGVEVVTGYRSAYLQNGVKLANDVLEVQAQTEISLNNEWSIGTGLWYVDGMDESDFSEGGMLLEAIWEKKNQYAKLRLLGRDFTNSIFQDGVEISAIYGRDFTEDISGNIGLSHDTAASAWRVWLEANWSHTLNEKCFVEMKTGVNFVQSFYDYDDGFRDWYGRASITYLVAKNVSFSPFLGFSIAQDEDYGLGGVLFEVTF